MNTPGLFILAGALAFTTLAGAGEAATRVSISENRWQINGAVTYPGTRAEGLLMDVRMVNATFEDRNKPDFDAAANADRFIAHIGDFAAGGVNA